MSVVSKVNELRREEKVFTNATVTVEPGSSKSVALGAYTTKFLQPRITLSAKPDMGGQLEASLERSDIPGSQRYVLFYNLQNHGTSPCTVTLFREG